jgi:hypothetical protein
MNNLQKMIELVLPVFKDEILSSGDWFFNLDDYTLNYLHLGDGVIKVNAYSAKDNSTDFSDQVFSITFKGVR